VLLMGPSVEPLSLVPLACACLDSFVLDYAARQKVGGTHLKFHVFKQLPVVAPTTYDQPCPWSSGHKLHDWLLSRVLELTYTAWDLEAFAQDCGYNGPPFRWSTERRFLLRCELDAAYFHLYGIEKHDVAYIMDTFPVVKRKDIEKCGEYRTQRVILAVYEALAEASRTGTVYQTNLNPPPGPPAEGLPQWLPDQERPADWP